MAERKCEQRTVSTECCDNTNDYSAESVLKRCLQAFKVSNLDDKLFKQKLIEEVFAKFTGKCIFLTNKNVPYSELPAYLCFLQSSQKGMDDKLRKKIENVLFSEKSWEFKMVEWKFKEDSGATYYLAAFGRCHNQQYVDIVVASFKIDSEVSKVVARIPREHSLFSWIHSLAFNESRDITPGDKSTEATQNFLRLKAFEEFRKQGIIDNIHYDNALEDIPDKNNS